MTDALTTASAAPKSRRLGLFAALAEAVAVMPVMGRGASGILAVAAGLMLATIHGPGGWLEAVIRGMALVTALAAWGAITRIAVAGELEGAHRLGLGPFGFQLTRVEARLLGAGALCALFMTIMLALLALVALAMFGFAGLDAEAIRARDWAAVGPTWKLALLAGVGLIVLGAPVVLAVRLSLFAPASVGRGQMISLTATGLTNGAMWPLLGGLVLLSVPTWACVVAAVMGVPATVATILGVLVYAGVQAPLTAGFLGAAYRRLETHDMLGAWQ